MLQQLASFNLLLLAIDFQCQSLLMKVQTSQWDRLLHLGELKKGAVLIVTTFSFTHVLLGKTRHQLGELLLVPV